MPRGCHAPAVAAREREAQRPSPARCRVRSMPRLLSSLTVGGCTRPHAAWRQPPRAQTKPARAGLRAVRRKLHPTKLIAPDRRSANRTARPIPVVLRDEVAAVLAPESALELLPQCGRIVRQPPGIHDHPGSHHKWGEWL